MRQDRPKRSANGSPSRTALGITHPDAAGIDIGSTSHCVAVPPFSLHEVQGPFFRELGDERSALRLDLGAGANKSDNRRAWTSPKPHELEQRAQQLPMTLVANELPA